MTRHFECTYMIKDHVEVECYVANQFLRHL